MALVRNRCGRLDLTVVLSEDVPRGVALAHKAVAHAGCGIRERQCLESGSKSDMGESTSVHSVEVSVEAVPR